MIIKEERKKGILISIETKTIITKEDKSKNNMDINFNIYLFLLIICN